MLYAILCYDNQQVVSAWSKEKDDQVMVQLGAVTKRLADEQRLGPVGRLVDTDRAKTIKKGPKPLVLDGPFAETKEQLLGFYIVDCASDDAALETAKELAGASGSAGSFEIRPLKYYQGGVLPR